MPILAHTYCLDNQVIMVCGTIYALARMATRSRSIFLLYVSFRLAGVPADAIRLSLFSFSLSGEAKRWLHSFKENSLMSWDEVVEKLLKKYFPESKTAVGKAAISSFH